MRKADLERALAAVPPHPRPSPELEQYRTPAAIAADLLRRAHADGAIAGRRVLDLGCGTGIFSIGAALLGADRVTAVDVDPTSLDLGRSAAAAIVPAASITWLQADVASWDPPPADTVLMNPPFGAQKANRHADRAFIACAAKAVRPAGTAWLLAQTRTEGFLGQHAKALGASIDRVAVWPYPLEATMAHHREAARTIDVGAYRLAFG